MKLDRRGIWATALIAAAVIPYLGYLAFGSVPFVDDARGMAAVGLVFGFASRRVAGRLRFQDDQTAFIGGFGATLLGIVAIATESDLVLALFMMSTVGLSAAVIIERTSGGRRLGAGSSDGHGKIHTPAG